MTCAVCLLPLDEDEGAAIVQTACRHRFHLSCLVRCLEHRSTSCPMCRQDIDAELADAPRPWMAMAAADVGSQHRSVLMGLAATEASVAVEIAESVRRSLMEDETRRASMPRILEATASHPDNQGVAVSSSEGADEFSWYPDIFQRRGEFTGLAVPEAAVAVEVAESVRRSLIDEETRMSFLSSEASPSEVESRYSGQNLMRGADQFAWDAEIVEAVAGTLARETRHLRNLASARDANVQGHEDGSVDSPDSNALHTASGLPMQHFPEIAEQECMDTFDVPNSSRASPGFNISESDIASIACAVLRSLDEDAVNRRL